MFNKALLLSSLMHPKRPQGFQFKKMLLREIMYHSITIYIPNRLHISGLIFMSMFIQMRLVEILP